jgi:ABC-type thiamine transport system substrate-binding protein
MLATGANNMTNFEFGNNILQRPNTSSTGGSFVSTTATAWTGHAYNNYMYQLDNTAGIWIATGTGGAFGFTNNYSPITGAVDKSALINPAAV